MIFNRWRKYPRRKPRKEGWYQCTVRYGYDGEEESIIVMDLYFWFAPDRGGVWVDRRRKEVFEGYKVYYPCRAAIDYNRVWEDSLCERVDVMAWKKLPRVYRGIGKIFKKGK